MPGRPPHGDHQAEGVNRQWSAVQTVAVNVDDVAPMATAADADSGLAGVEYQLDGGDWLPYATPVALDDAAHAVGLRASDVAGNTSPPRQVTVAAVPAPVATTAPRITGAATFGTVLRASSGTWDRPGLVFTYRWLRNSMAIAGATATTYRSGLPNGSMAIAGATATTYRSGLPNVGRRIWVRATATRGSVPPGTATS